MDFSFPAFLLSSYNLVEESGNYLPVAHFCSSLEFNALSKRIFNFNLNLEKLVNSPLSTLHSTKKF